MQKLKVALAVKQQVCLGVRATLTLLGPSLADLSLLLQQRSYSLQLPNLRIKAVLKLLVEHLPVQLCSQMPHLLYFPLLRPLS